MVRFLFVVVISLSCILSSQQGYAEEKTRTLQIATFQCDVTPPEASPLCFGFVKPVETIVEPLSARGLILLTNEKPIVLCAVDWVAISNGAHDAWRKSLADAVGTTFEQVSVHVLHPHDAPGVDYDAEEILAAYGRRGMMFNQESAEDAVQRTAAAARNAVKHPKVVSHIGYGQARVKQFASNRRVIGEDGKIKYWRGSATRNADARAEPEGTIDPTVRLVSFWNEETPLVSLTYYASHPQSYYGRGGVSADTVGMARSAREKAQPQIKHIHFNGAGGNIAAGKYNTGATANRKLLAGRLGAGMTKAWKATIKSAVTADDVRWTSRAVMLPLKKTLSKDRFVKVLADPKSSNKELIRAARRMAWMNRHESGHEITIGCLQLGSARILHMPGELFVEYQLAAQSMRPDLNVCMAAYSDHGPGYIGTSIAYSQGGYEVGPPSNTAPEVEQVLMSAMRELLEANKSRPTKR